MKTAHLKKNSKNEFVFIQDKHITLHDIILDPYKSNGIFKIFIEEKCVFKGTYSKYTTRFPKGFIVEPSIKVTISLGVGHNIITAVIQYVLN